MRWWLDAIDELQQIVAVVALIVGIILIYGAIMEYSYARVLNGVCSGTMYGDANGEPIDFPPTDEPVILLGEKYSARHQLEELREDIRSRIWITYRRGFSPIGGTGPTFDTGWGCMLRCGQMVLAHGLLVRYLGRDWRWKRNTKKDARYLRILRLFEDKRNATYSIHQISQMGASEGKPVGSWFGPNTIAQSLKKLAMYDKSNDIVIHVAMDNLVVLSDIRNLCRARPRSGSTKDDERNDGETWKPLILFIPLRLGLSEINPIYFRSLKTTFTLKQSLGIIGGRPNHALYFVGFVGNELIYLDPHTTQQVTDLMPLPALNNENLPPRPTIIDDSSYHIDYSSRMDINQLDPSVSLCFLMSTEAEFDSWANSTLNTLIWNEKQPLFELANEPPAHWLTMPSISSNTDSDVSEEFEVTLSMPSSPPVETAKEAFTLIEEHIEQTCDSDDEFVMLG